ncbi:MAG: hypothetical protein LAT64_13140 [Phycisphaerales bacterium]|nr:hypothetical protein [Planctomycetota bacterium]MCH8509700.1 hypothetical protein [Phycisphaerales bacterium]
MKLKNFRDIRTNAVDNHQPSPTRPLSVYEATKGVNELYVRTLRDLLRKDADLTSIAEAQVVASTVRIHLRDTTEVFGSSESACDIFLSTPPSEIAEFWSADPQGMKRIALRWADLGFRLFLEHNAIDPCFADRIHTAIGDNPITTYIHATKSSPDRRHRAEVLVEWEPTWAKVTVQVLDRAGAVLATRTMHDGRPHLLDVLWHVPRLTWLNAGTLEIDLHNLAFPPPKERVQI